MAHVFMLRTMVLTLLGLPPMAPETHARTSCNSTNQPSAAAARTRMCVAQSASFGGPMTK